MISKNAGVAWLGALATASGWVVGVLPSGCRAQDDALPPASDEPREVRESKFDNGQPKEKYSVKLGKDGSFLKDGLYTSFHQSTGQKEQEGHFLDDRPEGLWRRWDENGKVLFDGNYRAGVREGAFTVFADGKPIQRGTYVADKVEGNFSWMGISGATISGALTAEVPAGVWSIVDADGRKRAEATFVNGELSTPVALFSPEGAPITRPAEQGCAAFEGFTIDETTYWDALLAHAKAARFPGDGGTNKYSQGRMLTYATGFSIPWLKEVTLIFDQRDMLVALVATGKKSRAGFDELRNGFTKSYTLVKESVPFVGNATARFSSGTCTILLDAPHLSFETTVVMRNAWFDNLMAKDLPSSNTVSAPEQNRGGGDDMWGDRIGKAHNGPSRR